MSFLLLNLTYIYSLFNNRTDSLQIGDNKVSLPDLKTDDPKVRKVLNAWISDLVADYGIDGLRLDAAKHLSGYLTEFQNAGM